MFNLALGLALVTTWLVAYVRLPTWFTETIGIPLYYLAILGVALLVWGPIFALLRRRRFTVPFGRMYWVLLCSNLLAVSLLIVHAYNSAFIAAAPHSAAAMMDEIMNPRLSETIEFYLRVAYPFVKVLVTASVIAHIAFLVRTARSKNGNAA